MTGAAFNNAAEKGAIRTADPVPRRASVYRWQDERQQLFEFLFGTAGYAAGGLHASAADLAKVAVALQTGTALSHASLSAMWEAPLLPSGARGEFGIGWVVKTYRGKRVVGHSGGPALADVLHFPDDRLTIVVLTNQSRMYPYLAEGVADLLLPKGWTGRTAPDREPALTAQHRRVLEDAARGVVDDALFAPTARKEFVPALRGMGPDVLGLFDPIRVLEVVEDRTATGQRTRTYRVYFGTRPMIWVFEMDRDGKITSFRPGSE
jgi:CubicO group peptidase (beta-lactamase class C family)